jgi:hypothetical protein
MIKASIDLQDLRRRIYVKAKAEPSWRFWGHLPDCSKLHAKARGWWDPTISRTEGSFR